MLVIGLIGDSCFASVIIQRRNMPHSHYWYASLILKSKALALTKYNGSEILWMRNFNRSSTNGELVRPWLSLLPKGEIAWKKCAVWIITYALDCSFHEYSYGLWNSKHHFQMKLNIEYEIFFVSDQTSKTKFASKLTHDKANIANTKSWPLAREWCIL